MLYRAEMVLERISSGGVEEGSISEVEEACGCRKRPKSGAGGKTKGVQGYSGVGG